MSFKTLLKRIFSTAEANVVSGLEKLNSTEKRFNLAANKLCEEIRRLETARVANKREGVKLTNMAVENDADANKREEEIKQLLARGGQPNRAVVQIILHRRRIATALLKQAEELKASEDVINSAIVQLGDRLDTVKANLELARIKKETNGMGLSLPEDIEFDAGIVNVDVDALVREIEVQDSGAGMVSAPSSVEIENYLASLTAK